MAPPFYIYDNELIDSTDHEGDSIKIISPEIRIEIRTPSILLATLMDEVDRLLLCKIRRPPQAAANGTIIVAEDCITVSLNGNAIIKSAFDIAKGGLAYSYKEIPPHKFDLVKNAILKRNDHVLPSYFDFPEKQERSDIPLQLNDALHSGLVGIFGAQDKPPTSRQAKLLDFFRTSAAQSNLREGQILDLDWKGLFPSSDKIEEMPDGRTFYRQGNRLLYLYKTDRTSIEDALGVDLIYNYVEQGRAIFVQYKCPATNTDKYYHSTKSARNDRQLDRMLAIPGVRHCPNFGHPLTDMRLCRCPVFVKLCERRIRSSASVPESSYFPICIWSTLIGEVAGVSRTQQPHLNNEQFHGLVRSGLVGSTMTQLQHIQKHLTQRAPDRRIQLIFQETYSSIEEAVAE